MKDYNKLLIEISKEGRFIYDKIDLRTRNIFESIK